MDIVLIWALPFVFGYFLGSIPFGLILTRMFGAGDIRSIGSGNIGATNVLRTGRKGLAAATLLLDAGKGAAAVLIVSQVWNGDAALAGFGALIGHCYPVWLRFRGGKGVATMLGVSFGLDWRIGLASALVWLVVAKLTKISSAGGIASAVAAPVAAFVIAATIPIGGGFILDLGKIVRAIMIYAGVVLTLMALLVIWKHRENIARIRAGTEPKIGAKTDMGK